MAKKRKSQTLPTQGEESELFSNKEYVSMLAQLKETIQQCQLKAITAANKELVRLYWIIGKTIVEKQEHQGWGSNFIDKFVKDLGVDRMCVDPYLIGVEESFKQIVDSRMSYLADVRDDLPSLIGRKGMTLKEWTKLHQEEISQLYRGRVKT